MLSLKEELEDQLIGETVFELAICNSSISLMRSKENEMVEWRGLILLVLLPLIECFSACARKVVNICTPLIW